MGKSRYIWFNGKIIEWEKACINVMTHSLHYGTAVFEGIRSYKTIYGIGIFRLNDHIRRFFKSMKTLGMKIRYTEGEISTVIKTILKLNRLDDAYIRPIAFYDTDYMGIDLSKYSNEVSIAIAAWKWGKYLKKAYLTGAKVKISKWRRISPLAVPLTVKLAGIYINNVIARLEAGDEYDEVILLDSNGFISEGSGDNIFLVKDKKLLTPGLESSILPGITRDTIMVLGKEILGLKIIEKRIEPQELFDADEVFIVGTAAEVTPVTYIDNKPIGNGKPGKITRKLQNLYDNCVRGKIRKYLNWIDLIG